MQQLYVFAVEDKIGRAPLEDVCEGSVLWESWQIWCEVWMRVKEECRVILAV